MPAYNPALPNAYDQGQIPSAVRGQYFQELLLASPLSMFMGQSPNSLIQVIYQKDGQGPSSTFSVMRELDYKTSVKNYDQFSGKGQQIKFYVDRINIDLNFVGAKEEGVSLNKLYTPIKVFEAMKPALSLVHKQKVTYDILNSATLGNYNIATQGPVDNRVIYSGVATQNTIQQSIDAMNAPTPAASGMKVTDIQALRDMAVNGGKGTYRAEKRINPYAMETSNGWQDPFWVLFMDTKAYNSLQQDPLWTAQYQRGVIESRFQPSILRGSTLRGMIDNVYIYEVFELADFRLQSTDASKQVSWNLFCGAQAFGMIFNDTPWFKIQYLNFDEDVEMALFDKRGQKSLMFPSYQNEAQTIENGIIHYFTRYA